MKDIPNEAQPLHSFAGLIVDTLVYLQSAKNTVLVSSDKNFDGSQWRYRRNSREYKISRNIHAYMYVCIILGM